MKKINKILGTSIGFIFILFALVYYFFPGVIISGAYWAKQKRAGLKKYEVTIDQDTWVYLKGGNGEPLVLLHGFGQNKDLWDDIPASLAGNNVLIIPDLPGFGESTKDAENCYDIPSQAIRLNGFINKLALKEVNLAGISMGGGIAAYYAALYPEKIKKLILMSPFGLLSPEKSYTQQMRDKNKDDDKTIVYRSADEFDFLMSLLVNRPPEIPDHIKNYIAAEEKKQFALHEKIFKQDLMARENILEPVIPGIRAKTLLIWGKDDKLMHVSGVTRYSAAVKDLTTVVLDDCGHVPYMDQPEKTISAIKKFLLNQPVTSGR
ncbi:MAG TPA: alpha/beta hydrolase [Spirochaetota bacterium]|nr:alpha/beta hydrolase [Spirochaetota bacterium]HPI89260.1 alpha/beta hydrolase [Spirochaetota bacterium]HPR48580.1 alpha/beta hydrolase [Spirochaetota bacterium]